ncbi:FoF1 ATP synthase subunit delta/epsilon [Blattabacterium cuenoti]|uniref:FoF1 ATP synthase subunit delta/epsilon n=1 Tax=Blattabacterium cuenoti TaxID=1653831 RepID=UPI00163D014A|nr:F0F1 ATP synthase subunit epsilon [Blattabacterium cuenoti]
MEIKIFRYYKIFYQGSVISVIAPGYQGYFQILKNHAPFISILKNGILKLELKKDKKKEIKIEGGILRVNKNMVIIIT